VEYFRFRIMGCYTAAMGDADMGIWVTGVMVTIEVVKEWISALIMSVSDMQCLVGCYRVVLHGHLVVLLAILYRQKISKSDASNNDDNSEIKTLAI